MGDFGFAIPWIMLLQVDYMTKSRILRTDATIWVYINVAPNLVINNLLYMPLFHGLRTNYIHPQGAEEGIAHEFF